MSTDSTAPTPGQARDQLARTRPPLTDARDRRVHAITTATLGATVGAVMAVQNLLASASGTAVRAAVYVVVVGGALAWAERTARTVPRHAKTASRVGLVASLVAGLVLVLPWLNLSAQDRPNTVGMAILGAAAIALPSWVAAGYIARARR